ncbi:hypothetical protein IKG49_02770 [Candidatus Saccharibacteria bacterium]|nr:hypothetical protein [Candidatus Saccharibacteria bacterium]
MNKTLKFLSVPLAVTVIFGTLLSSYNVSADDVVDEINITVPVSCTMSGTGQDSHNATINNGQSNSTIGETTMKVFCNDNNGFAIYAIGYTDNTDGKNVLTSSTLGDNYNIVTGTATGPVGNTDISQWAMKLSTITDPTPTYPIIIAGSSADTDREQGDPDYSTFQEVPDDYTLVAKRTSGTDINPAGQSTAEGATLKSTYQAYISKTQPAGTYTGQVKYTLVHPNTAPAPTKPTAIESAMQLAGKTKINGYYKMQDLNSAICNSVNIEASSTTELIDVRDNQVYKVAKLKDGNCWMVENLNIAGGTALSSTDTDFDTNYTLPTTDGWTVTDGKLVLPASATKNPDDNHLTDDTQFYNNNYAYVFNSGNKTDCGESGQDTPCYSYYSWDAATLGSGRSISTDNTDAAYSICPKNWKLPTSRTTSAANWQTESDFYAFARQYGLDDNSITSFDEAYDTRFYDQAGPGTTPDFLLAGYYVYGSFQYDGSAGYYWSASSYSSPNWARFLYFNSGFISSANSDNRSYGYSVRCLLRTN